MKAYVALTDPDWHATLSALPHCDEANFWQPSGGKALKQIGPGEPLIFKAKKAHGGGIIGFGFFLRYEPMSVDAAWEVFGEKNGAASYAEMRERVAKYVRGRVTHAHRIGCLLLVSPFFVPMAEQIPGPRDWKPNIVAGKYYDLREGEGKRIWDELLLRAQRAPLDSATRENIDSALHLHRYGKPTLQRPRLGQGTFRLEVVDAYGGACAVSTEHSRPAIDAAHITPYGDGGTHDVSNGIALRADIHRLFDRGYVTITPDYEFKVSGALAEEFDNGKIYYGMQGRRIVLPEREEDRPLREALEWHGAECFRG